MTKASGRTWEELDALLDDEARKYIRQRSYQGAVKLIDILKKIDSAYDVNAIAGAFAGMAYIGLDLGMQVIEGEKTNE